MVQYAGAYPARLGVDANSVLLLISNTNLQKQVNSQTPNWLPIAQVVDVNSPSMTKAFHDVTPAVPGGWKKFVPGYKDAGSISMTLLFDSSLGSHSILVDSFRNDALETFRLIIPNNDGTYKYWGFTGYISLISTSHTVGGIIIGSVSIKLTGEIDTSTLVSGTDWPDIFTTNNTDNTRISIG